MVTTAVAECVMSGAGRAATAEMKVHVFVIALAASLLANAGPISAEKVLVYGQEASLIHEGAILLADTFKTSSDVWGKVSNYANGLKFTYGDDGLTISNNTGGKRLRYRMGAYLQASDFAQRRICFYAGCDNEVSSEIF